MTRLALVLLIACGSNEASPEPTPEEETAEDPECRRHASEFWSQVEAIEPQVVTDPPSLENPVRAAEPAVLALDHDQYRYVNIVIDSEMVKLEGHRLAPSELIADGESAPVALTNQLERMAESGNPLRVHIHADGNVAAGTLGSVLAAIGEHAEVFVLAYPDGVDANPRGVPADFDVDRIGALEGDARRQAVESALDDATEACPDLRDSMQAMMYAVLPSDGAANRLPSGHMTTTIEEKLVECGCRIDLEKLLAWYRASNLNRWGRLGAVSVEPPANARAWADKTIDDVVS